MTCPYCNGKHVAGPFHFKFGPKNKEYFYFRICLDCEKFWRYYDESD